MGTPITRRSFIVGGVAAGVSAVGLGRSARAAFAQASPSLRTRRSALELPANDPVFAKYADAVRQMHQKPGSDRRNWWQQAKIHADFCHHYSQEFLPWHRHYLNQFEKLCGSLIGDPTFAVPYWDWTDKRGKNPDALFNIQELNVTYWNDPGVYSSPNWPNIDTIGVRAIGPGVGVQDNPRYGGAFASNKINSILHKTDFSVFTGQLETTPHNAGHVVVGFRPTGKPGHIGSGLSPLDPLFWLHHCNVDRLWAQWQLAGNSTPAFGGDYNGQFVDVDGNPANVSPDGAIDFTALGYTYEDFANPHELMNLAEISKPFHPAKPIQATPSVIGAVTAALQVQVGVPASVQVPVSNLQSHLCATRTAVATSLPGIATLRAKGRLDKQMLSQFGRRKTVLRQILARIKGVAGDFSRPPIVKVFVNCPYLAPQTPWTDPHYADTFAFFAASHHDGHAAKPDFVVDLTNAVHNIDLGKADNLKLQFLALNPGVEPAGGSFQIGGIDILSA